MLKDNFNKFCLAVIALLVLLSLFFTIRASAEEYTAPEDAAGSSQDPAAEEYTAPEDAAGSSQDPAAEEYTAPEDAAGSSQDPAAEEHPVTQVQGVQTYDPTLYDKLDKLQESVDALTAAVAPPDGSNSADNEVSSQDPIPDYIAQISGISNQLEILTQQATAETAEPSAFEKPFEEYSTIEAIGLLAFVAFSLAFFVAAIKIFIF